MPLDRFPAPWRVTREEAAYCVVDRNGLVLARTAFAAAGGSDRTIPSESEALELAQGFAAVPELLRQLHAANLGRAPGDPGPADT